MRLIAFVTAPANFVFAEISASPCRICLLVALLAVEDFVLVAQGPTGIGMIKALFAELAILSFDRSPTHHVERTPLVFEVAVGARSTANPGGGVIALTRSNPCAQILVIVAI